jgi:hypothetical protein
VTDRGHAIAGLAAVVLLAAVAVVSAGAVPLGPAASDLVSDGATVTDTPETAADEGATLDYDGDRLSLAGAPNQTVAGEADLAAGSELTVRIVSSGGSPFLHQATTTVGDDGGFAATVDLSGVPENAAATVSVRHNGAELVNASARVTAVESATPTDGGEGGSGTRFVSAGDRLTVAALDNETVRGETDRDPGTELTVRLQSTGGSPFLIQETATVTDDGGFVADVDLVGTDNGTTFEATARHDGERIAGADGVVIGGNNTVSTTNTSEGDLTRVPVEETSPVAEQDHSTTFDYDGDRLTLSAAPNQTVAGETDLAPGTNVTVRLRSSDAANPFLRSLTATVSDDGRFTATTNMTAVEPGATFETTVRYDGDHDGDTIAVADGVVTE